MTGGIYRILNRISGKCYVGQTVNFRNRKNSHFHNLETGKHKNKHLQSAYDSYGLENFVFEILERIGIPEQVERGKYLIPYEQKWIDFYRSSSSEYGYNIAPVAGSARGIKRHPESIEKTASKNRGKKRTLKSREKMMKSHIMFSYEIVFPDGRTLIINNLNKFCRDNGLDSKSMHRILKGKQYQHKGFKVTKLSVDT